MSWGWGWRPYVPVAQRRAQAKLRAQKLAKKGQPLRPVEIDGRVIAKSFWGKAWCDNLESYSDFANRLPRGRTYVRNGSVIDLQIERGQVSALVSGSDIYKVKVDISTLPKAVWTKIQHDCARSIDSLMDLLMGRFSEGVMERLTRQEGGLFPRPNEINLKCSCPDWATLCKHVAATLYGVGARLDEQPELLFTLRDVDHQDLIQQAVTGDNLDQALTGKAGPTLAGDNLGEIFGIDLEQAGGRVVEPATTPPPPLRAKAKNPPADKAKLDTTRAKEKTKPLSKVKNSPAATKKKLPRPSRKRAAVLAGVGE